MKNYQINGQWVDLKTINDNWDNIPVEVKQKISKKRNEAAMRSQGKITFAPGFSFDSDSKVKLYVINI